MTQAPPSSDQPPSPQERVGALLRLLDVEPMRERLFQGMRKPGGRGRVYGGQVVAQALAAAVKTVGPDRLVHSLHAYFMRPGDEDYPIDYRVEIDFDGRSFCNRRVVAVQKDLPILNLVASFQRPEDGVTHQVAMPDVPPPEDLLDQVDYAHMHRDMIPEDIYRFLTRPNPIQWRPIGTPIFFRREKAEPSSSLWVKTVAPVDADEQTHRTILAFISDMGLLATSALPHGLSSATHSMKMMSIDHAMWFHEDVRADEWLLYTMDSPWSGHARGFNRGMFFRRDGTLVASCSQEGLIRIGG